MSWQHRLKSMIASHLIKNRDAPVPVMSGHLVRLDDQSDWYPVGLGTNPIGHPVRLSPSPSEVPSRTGVVNI